MAEYTKSEACDWARENLRGQWTTLMTPFDEDNELDEDALRHIVDHYLARGDNEQAATYRLEVLKPETPAEESPR